MTEKQRDRISRRARKSLSSAAALFVGAAKCNTDPIKALELPNSPVPFGLEDACFHGYAPCTRDTRSGALLVYSSSRVAMDSTACIRVHSSPSNVEQTGREKKGSVSKPTIRLEPRAANE